MRQARVPRRGVMIMLLPAKLMRVPVVPSKCEEDVESFRSELLSVGDADRMTRAAGMLWMGLTLPGWV